MFIAALFTISSTWKQPRYPSTNECYSAIKRNAVESILMRWMNLEPIILYQPRRVGWGRRWKGASKGRGYMYTYG